MKLKLSVKTGIWVWLVWLWLTPGKGVAAGDSIFPQMSNRANNRICLTHFVSCILLYSVFFITNRVFPSLNGPLGGLVESFVKESFVPLLNRSLLVLLNKNVFFLKENHARNSPPHKPNLNLWRCFSFLPLYQSGLSPLRPHVGVTFCSFAITVTERTALSQPFSNERGLQQSTPVFYQEQRQHSCCLIVEFGSQVSKKSLKQMSGFLVDLERLPVQSHWFSMTLREREWRWAGLL